MDMISEIEIKDNGSGICYEELKLKFSTFNESGKKVDKNNHSLPHGNRGVGRLTFFSFAQSACWNTIYEKDNEKYEYFISMNREHLNQYDDNNGEKPVKTNKEIPTGTSVQFEGVYGLYKDEIVEAIRNEFFWFLELNKEKHYSIILDDEIVNYENYVTIRNLITVSEKDIKHDFNIRFIHWNQSLKNEYSRFYYIDSSGQEIYKEATKLNKKSDEFYHSVFIQSDYFDSFVFADDMLEGQIAFNANTTSDIEYKTIIRLIQDYLIEYRKQYLKKASNKYINHLIDKQLYPVFNDDFLGEFRKKQLDDLVGTLYSAKPKIFTGLSDDNKKITLHLLNLIMENQNNEDLFNVLNQLIELDDYEMKELSDVLRYTSISNITRAIKVLEDRIRVINSLETIVFDLKNYALEVPHIQEVVQNHYWLFGEEYNLITAAEPDFEKALQGLIIKTIGKSESTVLEHEDKRKAMDIFMIRQDASGKATENVVVELKRPTIPLGEEQVSQVKKYMRVIQSDDRFNSAQVKWTYFLVGNKFNNNGYIEGELDSHKHLGEQGLIHSEKNGMHKIYVKTWSDIFDEFQHRHNYLLQKLNLQRDSLKVNGSAPQEIVKEIQSNSASMPKAIIS